jgi:integrase
MAQTVNQLTATQVQKLTLPGMYSDGAGLYLQVTSVGAKSWILRYSLRGRAREMGLGSLRKVSIAEARRKAVDYHRLLDEHIDPIEHRRQRRNEAALATANSITFREAAETYIAAHRAGLRNLKHAAQWRTTIATYAEPVLGKVAVREIDTGLVRRVLEPIWITKAETASRVRGRIEAILDWAKVSGYRSGENPARWRGNLDKLLSKRSRTRSVKHHRALRYDELPTFMQALRLQKGTLARMLEFCILTAARSGEVIKAGAAEINREKKMWTTPAERMKSGKEHRVPLSDQALELTSHGDGTFLFPGYQPGRPFNEGAMLKLLKRMGFAELTVHGFRSTFKDWARDRTNFDNYVVEAALAHSLGDKVEAAYARSDVIEKRRKLMAAWAAFCASTPVSDLEKKVVTLRSARTNNRRG